jgi:D-alanyl-D-alanine-carboxypeptidase/D-alanyl-D-alanine-endopeptidase
MAVLVVSLFIVSVVQAADEGGTVAATVSSAVKSFLKETPQSVGLSIGVFKAGGVYEYNYGTVKKGTERLPTAHTLYPIASITKTFTGTLLAQAVVEKKLKLDDDVRKYLDGNYPNLEFQGHPIRLQDLTNHRSGLPFFLPDRPETQPNFENDAVPWTARLVEQTKHYSRQDFFADLHKVTLTFIPGEKASYSNSAAQLMGYILERVYGTSYEALLKKKILDPLKMNDTTMTVKPSEADHVANGYDEHGNVMPNNNHEVLEGAGALNSSVGDMLKYARWQIDESDAAVRLTHAPYFTIDNYSAGLNWQMMSSGDNRLIWQNGTLSGFHSLCIILPKLKLGLVILTNESDKAASHNLDLMAKQILREFDARANLLP